MDPPAKHVLWALTDKEKQTLRLIVRGHDAKSTARSLGLSVHTINERLREARRKMAVSSSREAARLLLDAEGGSLVAADPQSVRDAAMGEDGIALRPDQESAPIVGVGPPSRSPWIITGVLLMMLAFGLLALTALPQIVSAPSQDTITSAATPDPEVVDTARQWLVLVDQGRWDESYRATGAPFRKLNTASMWATASEKVRVPLGAVITRTLIGQENLPAPPDGYEVVKFRTSFARKAEATETVTLERDGGRWRVVGATIR